MPVFDFLHAWSGREAATVQYRVAATGREDRGELTMGIQHAPKSQRNANKKRRKARKHKLRSSKKYKGGVR
jgi:hypothetical protein